MSSSRLQPGYITDAALRTGGELKASPEDFEVEEIPAYEPSGEGEHLFLWVEKRDVSADMLLGHLSRALDCSRGDIGMAGLKDRRAVTRQWVSVPSKCENRVEAVNGNGISILKTSRHRNKLRTGHLRGNRFIIRLRDVEPDAASSLPAIVTQVQERGVPNLYGDQRFGIDESTLRLGTELLRGEKTPRDIPYAKRKFLLRMALSSVQSALFNDVLSRRLADGLLQTVLTGDVMQVAASGGPFVVEDAAIEQARFDTRETVISGPMFGPDMKRPTGIAAQREQQTLEAWGFNDASFEQFRNLTPGTRRPLIIQPESLEASIEQNDGVHVILRFALPSGAYATSVVREFTKQDAQSALGIPTETDDSIHS